VVNSTPRPLYPRERPVTHCIGGWVSPRAGLDGCGKSRPPLGIDHRTVRPVASLTFIWRLQVTWIWVQSVWLPTKRAVLSSCKHRQFTASGTEHRPSTEEGRTQSAVCCGLRKWNEWVECLTVAEVTDILFRNAGK